MRLSLHSDLPTADPYLPGHGDPSWSAAHYALDIYYDLAGNMLRAEAVIDAVAEPDEGTSAGSSWTSPASTSPR